MRDLNLIQIISFLQEVTLGHPKRNIKNHAVMFWNASFAHSQTLKYPENLRYVRWFSSAIVLSGCTLQVIFVYHFLFQTSSTDCQRKNVTYSARLGKHQGIIMQSVCFKATLKSLAVNKLGPDFYFLWGGSLGNFLGHGIFMSPLGWALFFLVSNTLWKNFLK